VVEEAELDLEVGIVGDNWRDRTDNLETQITIINSRALNLMAGSKDRWQVAGDQLIVDMDISIQNLPPGSRVAIGTTVIEFSEKPHTGCEKFSARFGLDSLQFVSTPTGRDLRLRGVNCRLIQPGTIRVGDTVTKVTN
jgi:MOSC domain-containing protein YiiM